MWKVNNMIINLEKKKLNVEKVAREPGNKYDLH